MRPNTEYLSEILKSLHTLELKFTLIHDTKSTYSLKSLLAAPVDLFQFFKTKPKTPKKKLKQPLSSKLKPLLSEFLLLLRFFPVIPTDNLFRYSSCKEGIQCFLAVRAILSISL